MPWPNTSNKSSVSRMIQVMESSNRMRVTIANANPKKRVRACMWGGIRPTRIAIMMMLSMPRTISRAVKVKNAIQISGLISHSMLRVSCVGHWESCLGGNSVISTCLQAPDALCTESTQCAYERRGDKHRGHEAYWHHLSQALGWVNARLEASRPGWKCSASP